MSKRFPVFTLVLKRSREVVVSARVAVKPVGLEVSSSVPLLEATRLGAADVILVVLHHCLTDKADLRCVEEILTRHGVDAPLTFTSTPSVDPIEDDYEIDEDWLL